MLREKTGRRGGGVFPVLFLVLTAACLAIGMWAFFYSSPMKEKLFSPEGRWMVGETLFFFAWQLFFLHPPGWCFKKIRRDKQVKLRAAGMALGFCFGLWCHQILIPFLASGCWLAGLLLFGDVFFRRVKWFREKKDGGCFRLLADFLMGSSFWVCLVCVLSAFRIGGVGRMRWVAAGLFLAALAETGAEIFVESKKDMGRADAGEDRAQMARRSLAGEDRVQIAERSLAGKDRVQTPGRRFDAKLKKCLRRAGRMDGLEKLFCAVILTMVFVQLARINLLPDYDSLHYGLRSHYILDAGHGIYEDLGNIHLVYTYSKGWEILTFPLSGTITYGFQLCFNLWMAVLVVVLTAGLAFRVSERRKTALFSGMLVSLIPGIMNMGITAKSDLLTLVCQIGILWAAVEIFKTSRGEEKAGWFGIALGACLFSFALKPTSLVFSTLLSLCCLGALILGGGFSRKEMEPSLKEAKSSLEKTENVGKKAGRRCLKLPLSLFMPAFFCTAALAGTWIRTWRMTGVPTTSVFTSIWEMLGFSVKWPYAFSSIPNEGMRLEAGERAAFWQKRLLGILFAPAGNDMFHVRLAWGSSIVFLGLVAWLFWGMGRGKEKSCLKVSIAVMGLFNLLSLYLLPQVDGNYYMLFYVLTVLAASFALENSPFLRTNGQEQKASRSVIRPAAVVFAGFLLIQTGLILGTNWAGTKGFSPVKLLHCGVVNHQQERYREKCAAGNGSIWNILSENPRTRVIAAGEHPMVLQFPCNVQSYYDITGSGGNVRLVKTLEDFKKFLRFAQTEYIYVEAGYLEEGSRAYDVVRYLIEEGSLVQLYFEAGNMLGRVNLDGAYPANPQEEAEAFYRQIGMKVLEE